MVRDVDIYAATSGGLDILKYYYPDMMDANGNVRKKFKVRAKDSDPSAAVKEYNGVWRLTDFGDSGKSMSPIDVTMREERVEFAEAIAILAARYDIASDRISREKNMPTITRRDARPDEQEGSQFFSLEEKFTATQLQLLGPRVTQDTVDSLHWFVAKSYSYVRNRIVTTKETNENYPIFMRQCTFEDESGETRTFYKIYEPLNADKQYRFSYTPAGVKPKSFINGYAELAAAYTAYNEKERAAWESDPLNENKPYKEQKLPEAIICSGERDALCVRAYGYHPLWFNSETYEVSEREMQSIYKLVERVYNIPDIDATGIRRGTELALRYIDIFTIWLPMSLLRLKDRRGKPRKDFRDYVEVRPAKKNFLDLLNVAMPARFWESRLNERTKRMQYEINSSYLHNFLKLNGYYTLHDDDSDDAKYIRVQGPIVRSVKLKEIPNYLIEWAKNRYLSIDIRNLIINSTRTNSSTLAQLDELDPNFCDFTPESQYMFFENATWLVTATGIQEQDEQVAAGHYVWDNKVIKHRVRKLDEMFAISMEEDIQGEKHFRIEVKDSSSLFFKYLINTSRIYWREELEQHWTDKGVDEAEAYRAAHKFDIAGPLLSHDQIEEQMANLVNKIFAIGYNLHRHKSPSQAWALYAMDNKIGDDDQANGRSGKSFMFKAFRYFMSTVNLSGRNYKLLDNPHVFDQVNRHTDFILVDDCDKYLPVAAFYDYITSGLTVNPKNNQSFFIEFEDSPKFGFTTNFVPKDFDPSTEARLLYMVFSDYYHERTEDNDYLESRSIRDDFGHNLMTETDYTEDMWNADLNFFAQCLRFYLYCKKLAIKIQPPMKNIVIRKYKSEMGAAFEDWAYSFFGQNTGNLDKMIVRTQAYEAFTEFAKVPKSYWTMQRFTRALKAFAETCPYILEMNPEHKRNSNGRVQGRDENGKTQDMIYMESLPADKPNAEDKSNDAEELPF